jgi:hypothetical protein
MYLMSAEEKVFSVPELRLYILQYAIEDQEMERNIGCVKKCKEKIDPKIESCMWNIFCCCICCFCYRPNVSMIFR